jgi:hypothetical protein
MQSFTISITSLAAIGVIVLLAIGGLVAIVQLGAGGESRS